MSETMNKNLEPDGRFVENLEWQLASEYRRAQRFPPAAGRIAVPRGVAAAVLAAVFLTTGVTVIKASEMIKDSWRKKIEVARAETDVRLAQVRLEAARAETARIKNLFSVGAISSDEARRAELEASSAELALERARVCRDEVEATGEAPSDELFAPTAAGRDFVRERLELERRASDLAEAGLQVRLARYETLRKVGLVPEAEGLGLKAELAARQAFLEEIRGRMELRRRFIEREMTALEVEVQGRLGEAEQRLKAASSRVEELQARLTDLSRKAGLGLVPPGEVRALQAELESAKAVMKLASIEKAELQKARSGLS